MKECIMLIALYLFLTLFFTSVQSECPAGKINVNAIIDKFLPYVEKTLPTIVLNVKHGKRLKKSCVLLTINKILLFTCLQTKSLFLKLV